MQIRSRTCLASVTLEGLLRQREWRLRLRLRVAGLGRGFFVDDDGLLLVLLRLRDGSARRSMQTRCALGRVGWPIIDFGCTPL